MAFLFLIYFLVTIFILLNKRRPALFLSLVNLALMIIVFWSHIDTPLKIAV